MYIKIHGSSTCINLCVCVCVCVCVCACVCAVCVVVHACMCVCVNNANDAVIVLLVYYCPYGSLQ